MKKENQEEIFFNLERINIFLLLIFVMLNDFDYLSTYMSIIDWWIEINPIIKIMLEFPLIFFVWKILILPTIVWYIVYESYSKKIMWSMIWVNLIYFVAVWGNFRVVF